MWFMTYVLVGLSAAFALWSFLLCGFLLVCLWQAFFPNCNSGADGCPDWRLRHRHGLSRDQKWGLFLIGCLSGLSLYCCAHRTNAIFNLLKGNWHVTQHDTITMASLPFGTMCVAGCLAWTLRRAFGSVRGSRAFCRIVFVGGLAAVALMLMVPL